MREKYGIIGNLFEDFFAVLLIYPMAAVQMDEHMAIEAVEQNGDAEVGKSIESFEFPETKAPYDDPAMEVHQRNGKRQDDQQFPEMVYMETTFV